MKSNTRRLLEAIEARGLTPSERVVLTAYANHIGANDVCWAKQSTIAEAVELSVSQVHRVTKSLVEKKWIEVIPQYHEEGGRKANLVKMLNANAGGPSSISAVAPPAPKGEPLQHQCCSPSSTSAVGKEHPIEHPIERKRRFTPPSHAEVSIYGKQIGLSAGECEAFHDHYSSNGWKVGGRSPMKCWKSALRNWQRRSGEFTNGSGRGGNPNQVFKSVDDNVTRHQKTQAYLREIGCIE